MPQRKILQTVTAESFMSAMRATCMAAGEIAIIVSSWLSQKIEFMNKSPLAGKRATSLCLARATSGSGSSR